MERNLTKDKWKAFNSEQRRLRTNYGLGYDKYDNGGMIVDPMGQWAHPGKNTRIPGSSITTKSGECFFPYRLTLSLISCSISSPKSISGL